MRVNSRANLANTKRTPGGKTARQSTRVFSGDALLAPAPYPFGLGGSAAAMVAFPLADGRPVVQTP